MLEAWTLFQVGSYVIDVTVSSLSVPRSLTNANNYPDNDMIMKMIVIVPSWFLLSSSSPLIAKAYDATLIKVSFFYTHLFYLILNIKFFAQILEKGKSSVYILNTSSWIWKHCIFMKNLGDRHIWRGCWWSQHVPRWPTCLPTYPTYPPTYSHAYLPAY